MKRKNHYFYHHRRPRSMVRRGDSRRTLRIEHHLASHAWKVLIEYNNFTRSKEKWRLEWFWSGGNNWFSAQFGRYRCHSQVGSNTPDSSLLRTPIMETKGYIINKITQSHGFVWNWLVFSTSGWEMFFFGAIAWKKIWTLSHRASQKFVNINFRCLQNRIRKYEQVIILLI